VIYYLKEVLGILPDCYEKCRECHCIFDSYNEGTNNEGTNIDATVRKIVEMKLKEIFQKKLTGCIVTFAGRISKNNNVSGIT